MYDSPANRRRKRGAHPSQGRERGRGEGERESVISFSGGGERDVSPTVVPKYGEINKLLKLKSSVSLPRLASPVPLSAGIKDPHKFHSARPSTLAGARTGVGSLHPWRRNARARASGIASSWHPPFEPEKFRKKKRNYTPSLPSFSRRHARETLEIYARLISAITWYTAVTSRRREKSAREVLLRDYGIRPFFPLPRQLIPGYFRLDARTLCENRVVLGAF